MSHYTSIKGNASHSEQLLLHYCKPQSVTHITKTE